MHASMPSPEAAASAVAAAPLRVVVTRLDRALGSVVEVLAALLVLAEIALLSAGVIARYALHSPITWNDELASILFLWLAMFGAVIAMRRGAHMRMTSLVARAGERKRVWLDMLAAVVSLVLAGVLLHAGWDYAADEAVVMTPALGISSAWRAAAIPAGLGLIILAVLMQLAKSRDMRAMLVIAAGCVALSAALFFLQPVLKSLGNWNLLVFFGFGLATLILCGVPIAFAFGVATVAYVAFATRTPVSIVVGRMDEGMSHLILLSAPLFIFLGLLLEMTGMARAMLDALAGLLGRVRGGMSYVLLGAMVLVSGISGSKAADMAAIAPSLFPEMKRRGAKPGELAALLSASGAMSETIPPSLVLITVGATAGVSISALFAGGLVPAIVMALALGAVAWWRARGEDLSGVQRTTVGRVARSFVIAAPAIALPFIIRAAVVEGVATATEVSTIGILYTVVVGALVYRQFDWRRLGSMLVDTASLTGAIILIIGTATAMAWALTQSGFARDLTQFMSHLPGGAVGFMIVSIAVFIVLGSVLEGIPAIVLFGPLLFPIARTLGIHDVHYAMVAILAMGIGLFAPPLGIGYYTACAIGQVNPEEGVRPIVGYLVALVIGLVVVAIFPWFSIGFLPQAR
ncbi:TRAP transporter, DctM subunit [Variovorax sp. OK212]|nr:TRAP transporter, DctM subunit [Variovorax sp. OK202]SFE48060.1 TRAP transporter, DctM subunit [Variovorax sp. OK212]